MIKKSIIAILAIIAGVGLIFAAYGDNGDGNSNSSNDLEKQKNADNSKSNSNITSAISATKAQEIAKKYIEEPGARAGTPKLTSIDGKEVYIVPVIDNGQQVGEIEIDAQTGENLGGAGGAP